eukprot:UN27846
MGKICKYFDFVVINIRDKILSKFYLCFEHKQICLYFERHPL